MRKHLIKYFEEHMIQPFPVISTRRTESAKLINIGVYCYCKCVDDGAHNYYGTLCQ